MDLAEQQGVGQETRPGPHARHFDDVIASLNSDRSLGLARDEPARRRERFGFNELRQEPPEPLWKRFLGQFTELVIWILIGAAVVSGLLGEWIDAIVILAIVLLNGILGFFQEERAGRALAALQRLSAPQSKVIREGELQLLPARELVPGDRIELEAGDNVPADARLLDASSLRVLEAPLTGESVPTDKDPQDVLAADAPLAERDNMVYMGTTVASGKAGAIVTATGMHTELGNIAGMLQRHEPEPTPLQRRLTELGRMLIVVILAIIAVIFALELMRGGELVDVFLLSVSLAVAAVPEGMPAVVTIALALGLQRMVKRNALVRKLPSVETLGSVTVICSDKTGTLTRNEMTVRELVAGETRYAFTGSGYSPGGSFQRDGQIADARADPGLRRLLTVAALCNHARVRQDSETGAWLVIGDPTEGALVVAALAAGIEGANAEPDLVREIPFDSDRKMMSVVAREQQGKAILYTKGAPEVVLDRSTHEEVDGQRRPLTDERRQQIMDANHAMAERAMRVLGLAFRDDIPHREPGRTYREEDLTFVGLIGMIDPPREEAKRAVGQCHAAGIRPVMITGDHPDTALAIARELAIAGPRDRVVTGQELDRFDDSQLAAQVEQIRIYARVSAAHKMRVVDAWQQRGQVVAMTGDGVNDAPAVKAADIGIAMGVTGTDVTKEASDMVLMDDNFASIVSAVEEGRGIFDNIQKFVQYLLSCNAGEILLMFFAALVGWPAPLMAIQILWINLVTDGLPALALSVEPPEPDIMRRPPRPPREPVITWARGRQILTHGLLIAATSAVAFWWIYRGDASRLLRAEAVAFCTIAYAQLFYSFGCRSQRYTLPQLGAFTNPKLLGAIALSAFLQFAVVTTPGIRDIFTGADELNTAAPRLTWEWFIIIGTALVPVTIVEVSKIIRSQVRGRAAP